MKTIYYHGEIITMDEENLKVEAVCVEEGKICKVGTKEEVMLLQDERTRMVDLKGHTLLPGFIDGHSHFVGVANALSQCDLSSAKNFEDIVERMKQFIKENDIGKEEWVFGNSYDHNFLVEKKHPDKMLLDKISTTNPIVIVHASSHMGVANSKALERMHIDATTIDPSGGKYRRVEGSQEPDGFMEENAFINFQNAAPMIGVERLMKLMVKAQEIYASYGITTVQDGMVARPLSQLLQLASSKELLKLDVVGYIDLNTCRELTSECKEYVKKYVNHFKIGGYKIFLDGSPQGRTAWMETPYVGQEKEYYGYPVLKDERLEELITMALEDHLQLLAHCNGDAAANQYISQFEKVVNKRLDTKTYRPVMIHAQLVRKDQLKRMVPLAMTPSFFVAHTYYWGDIHIENFGYQRASKISPVHDAKDVGIRYTFHQDSPVVPPDMMRTLWCAVNRQTKTGKEIGKEEAVSVYDALKAITIYGAYQYFEEDSKGTISEGKLADLVILDKNPLQVDPLKLADINVLETIKEGKTIYLKS